MDRLWGSLFFVSAGVLLAVTKSPDIFTVAAVAACALLAALSSGLARWSAMGGALLIGASLALQTALSYRCLDCIKADLLILAGVIYLSAVENGTMKKPLRGMAVVVAVMFMANALMHYPLFPGQPLEAAQSGKASRFISVSSGGKGVSLDTSVLPALLFSPSCGACRSTVGEMVETDPEGKGWIPVQVGGDQEEASVLLNSIGYKGVIYHWQWGEAVPALITTRDGKTKVVYGQEAILKAVRGDTG